jgi:type IV secretory pathway VirB10-like protein
MHRDDATPSQLDIIAEINARAARQHRGRWAQRVAMVGGAVLLGAALWWYMQGGALRAPSPVVQRDPVPAETPRDTPAALAQATPVASAAAGSDLRDPSATPAQGTLAASAPIDATTAPLAGPAAVDKRARMTRARASELQQERSQAETQTRQQRESDREAQQARELADAASRRAAEQAPPAPNQPAAEPRRDVRGLCSASRNLVSEQFCHSRECRKPEHANDAICVRLREIEQSRQSGSQ